MERLGRPGEAVGYYASALRLDPTLSEFQLRMGQALQKIGRLDQALDMYLDLNHRFPQDPQMHQVTGAAYEVLDDFDLALMHYNEAARLDSTYALAPDRDKQLQDGWSRQMATRLDLDQILRRGCRLNRLGMYNSSLWFYRQALAKTSDPGRVLFRMGDVYVRQDSLDQVMEMYRKALNADPEAVEPKRKLGNTYLKHGLPDLAAEQYEAVLIQRPNDPKAHYCLGNIRLAANDLTATRRHFEPALKSDPSHFAARRLEVIKGMKRED